VSPKKHLAEFRGEYDLALGDQVTVDVFSPGDVVAVTGVSKGKGFQGVIKRHGFKGGPASHGSRFHRAPGSIGASADPARVYPGTKLPGQMGNKKITQTGLTVVAADVERNLLMVKGSVPGSKGSLVFVRG
jgi:large subunit ribosomal protein L3